MAFDQNLVPKDLRPLNIARTVAEESRIAPVTTSGRSGEGFYMNPPRDGSPGSAPAIYYPGNIYDAAFGGLAYGNAAPIGVPGWVPRVAPPQPPGVLPVGMGNMGSVSSSNMNFGVRVGGSASDQASDEGGDDSLSGRKVKFLCSFGGKILPRPSDGALRYVGGQTRIISVRRDVSFGELVRKMVDTYGQYVVIKYQLPDEDLDALVSVSCPDDLVNMMDEYEKLAERSSDGSAKLRVFLFPASEVDSAAVFQFGDLLDSGQRYVEAVNGIMEGAAGSGIMRKGSTASATSTQNSDVSGAEAVDSLIHGQVEVMGPPSSDILSPSGNSAISNETAPKMMRVDSNPAIYSDTSVAPQGIPVNSGPFPASLVQAEHESDKPVLAVPLQQQFTFDFQQPGISIRGPSPYLQAYKDPRQETSGDYFQLQSQMGFPTQLSGTVGPVFTQQHIAAGSIPQQFVPAVHMTMTPSHVTLQPNAVLPLVQPPQIHVDQYPLESTIEARLGQVPSEHGYSAYHSQVPYAPIGGGYGWHPVAHPEHVPFCESWMPHQQILSADISRFEDCHLCQKSLPHAHSDTIAQDQKESPIGTGSDPKSVYHSLCLDEKGRPINRAITTGAPGEVMFEQQEAGSRTRIMGNKDHEAGKSHSEGIAKVAELQYENDRVVLAKSELPEHPKVSLSQVAVGLTGGMQAPYGVMVGTPPQSYQGNVMEQLVVPSHYQVKPEAVMTKPINRDLTALGGMPTQHPEYLVHESPRDSGSVPAVVRKEDNTESVTAYDYLGQIDGRMENLCIHPADVLTTSEQSQSPLDNFVREDISDSRLQRIGGRDTRYGNVRPTELVVVCSSSESGYLQNCHPAESYEVARNPALYAQAKLGVNPLVTDDIFSANAAFSGVNTGNGTERILHTGELKDSARIYSPIIVHSEVEAMPSDRNIVSSLSPSYGLGDVKETSNSLFSNQDPWNMRNDDHFPPPRPSKIQLRKELSATKDPSADNRPGNSGELPTINSGGFITEVRLEDSTCHPSGDLNVDFSLEHGRPNKGSAEELIKQELQAVAEGVAASVLQTSIPCNSELSTCQRSGSPSTSLHNEDQNSDTELQHRDKLEEIRTKFPERTNLGFPASDGIGRLQIIKNSDLEEIRELGSGTFGTVYHGKWRGTDVAIKRINDRCFAGKASEQERMRDDFWNEAIKLADLHHPNVVAFYGVVLDGPGGSVATVTEYMVNGSLRTALQKSERNLDKRKRLLIAMDVAFGMEYLHGRNIVHFDLKSDNLLVNLRDPHRPICKVGDLGLSKVKCQTLISGGVRGTLPWMAPELLNGSSSLVSEKVDVFSFGIVMWELLTGEEPYADLHYGAIIGGIVNNTLRPPVPESCDPEWRSLMERCWSSETSERPSFTEIANELRSISSKLPPKEKSQATVPPVQLPVRS